MGSQLLLVLLKWLRSLTPLNMSFQPLPGHPLLLRWQCLCTGKLCEDVPDVSEQQEEEEAALALIALIIALACPGAGCPHASSTHARTRTRHADARTHSRTCCAPLRLACQDALQTP